MRRKKVVLACEGEYYGPAPVSWLIWALFDGITFFVMLGSGTVNGQIFVAFAGGSVVAVWALTRENFEWGKYDTVCIVGSLASVVAWFVFDSPSATIVSSLTLGTLALTPTLVNVWRSPQTESGTAWALWTVSGVIAIWTAPAVTVEAVAQPFVFFLSEAVVVMIILLRRVSSCIKRIRARRGASGQRRE